MDTIAVTRTGETSANSDEFVIFSIDKWDDPSVSYKFEKVLSYDDMLYGVSTKKLIGSYKGVLETSYITPIKHFKRLKLYGFFDNQECFLKIIIQGNRMLAYDLDTGNKLGEMVQLPAAKAIQFDGWSYRPDLQAYYVIL